MAFTDDIIQETGFLAIILNAALSQREKIVTIETHSKLPEPYSYAGAIQYGWLSANFDRQSAKSFPNFGEIQHFCFRNCFSRYSSHVPMTSSGFVEFHNIAISERSSHTPGSSHQRL